MKASTERKVIRWVHIILSIPVIGYIYGPVAQLHYAALAVRWVFFPDNRYIRFLVVERVLG